MARCCPSGIIPPMNRPVAPVCVSMGLAITAINSTAFDSLLAKVIVSTNADNFAAACAKAGRALTEFRIEGLSANTDFLQNILSHADFIGASIHTRWVDDNMHTLAAPSGQRIRYVSVQRGRPRRFCWRSCRHFRSAGFVRSRCRNEKSTERGSARIRAIIGPDGSVGVSSPFKALSSLSTPWWERNKGRTTVGGSRSHENGTCDCR